MAFTGEQAVLVDLSINCLQKPEIFDEDVLSQSIISILSTSFGERVRIPTFGSTLPTEIFENIDNLAGENLVSSIINSLKSWEDRITILENRVEFIARPNSNTLEISIPYIINSSGQYVVFNKVVSL